MIYFLTENKLKDYTITLGNVDFLLINPIIKTNAEMWIQPSLGTYFYNHLLNAYNNQTLNSDELIIMDMIQSALGWRVTVDLVISTSAQLSNKGVQEQNGLNSNIASSSKIGMLTNHYRSKAEYFENQLRHYLYNNKNLFPQYCDKLNNDCTVFYRPSKKQYNDNNIHFF